MYTWQLCMQNVCGISVTIFISLNLLLWQWLRPFERLVRMLDINLEEHDDHVFHVSWYLGNLNWKFQFFVVSSIAFATENWNETIKECCKLHTILSIPLQEIFIQLFPFSCWKFWVMTSLHFYSTVKFIKIVIFLKMSDYFYSSNKR